MVDGTMINLQEINDVVKTLSRMIILVANDLLVPAAMNGSDKPQALFTNCVDLNDYRGFQNTDQSGQ